MNTNYLKYKDFIGTVSFSEKDETFFGKIAGIDDLVTFEGSSVSQLKKAFKEAVEDYLALCRSAAKPAMKSAKGSFNVRIDPQLHLQAAKTAVIRNISLNQFVQEAIQSKLAEPGAGYNISLKKNSARRKPAKKKK